MANTDDLCGRQGRSITNRSGSNARDGSDSFIESSSLFNQTSCGSPFILT
jgi:hypothetical protein